MLNMEFYVAFTSSDNSIEQRTANAKTTRFCIYSNEQQQVFRDVATPWCEVHDGCSYQISCCTVCRQYKESTWTVLLLEYVVQCALDVFFGVLIGLQGLMKKTS